MADLYEMFKTCMCPYLGWLCFERLHLPDLFNEIPAAGACRFLTISLEITAC